MSYSLQAITSVADCDALIRFAQREKRAAEVCRTNLSYRSDLSAESSQDRTYDLQDAQNQLANTVLQMAGLNQESVDWKKLEGKRRDQDARVYKLQLSTSLSSGYNLLEREFELKQVEVSITEADVFITEVTAKKAELAFSFIFCRASIWSSKLFPNSLAFFSAKSFSFSLSDSSSLISSCSKVLASFKKLSFSFSSN